MSRIRPGKIIYITGLLDVLNKYIIENTKGVIIKNQEKDWPDLWKKSIFIHPKTAGWIRYLHKL